MMFFWISLEPPKIESLRWFRYEAASGDAYAGPDPCALGKAAHDGLDAGRAPAVHRLEFRQQSGKRGFRVSVEQRFGLLGDVERPAGPDEARGLEQLD